MVECMQSSEKSVTNLYAGENVDCLPPNVLKICPYGMVARFPMISIGP